MAIVNVDLSEYDAIRKRNSELEEQVKELKKLNDSLKQGAKVILRKETVVEVNVPRPRYGRFEPILYIDVKVPYIDEPFYDGEYGTNCRLSSLEVQMRAEMEVIKDKFQRRLDRLVKRKSRA